MIGSSPPACVTWILSILYLKWVKKKKQTPRWKFFLFSQGLRIVSDFHFPCVQKTSLRLIWSLKRRAGRIHWRFTVSVVWVWSSTCSVSLPSSIPFPEFLCTSVLSRSCQRVSATHLVLSLQLRGDRGTRRKVLLSHWQLVFTRVQYLTEYRKFLF